VSLLEHAREYLAFAWNDVAAKPRSTAGIRVIVFGTVGLRV
jgi:hypothetical protein